MRYPVLKESCRPDVHAAKVGENKDRNFRSGLGESHFVRREGRSAVVLLIFFARRYKTASTKMSSDDAVREESRHP